MAKTTGRQPAKPEVAERDAGGRFRKGNATAAKGGRPKGAKGLFTAELKADIQESYHRRGGIEWLESLPSKEYVPLILRMMPKEVKQDILHHGQIDLALREMDPDELRRLAEVGALDEGEADADGDE